MGGFYQTKRERKYQSEMAEMFSDVKPPYDEQTEDSGAFSLDPIGFAEMTESLCRDAEILFSQTAVLHRLSETFLKCTENLDKLIRRLGSCCLTKAALEARGQALPELEGLDIRKLYCLGSFNFRKCHASIRDGINKQHQFNILMMQAECSWFHTLERLKSTEERIAQIREGKIKVDSLLQRDGMFRDHGTSVPKEKDSGETAYSKAPSFPILRSAVGEPEAEQYVLKIGTSREPKGNRDLSGGRIIRPMSPARIRKEIEKKRREKARQEREEAERSEQAVDEAVAAIMAQRPEKARPDQKPSGNGFRPETEKSAVEKWNEILALNAPPDEKPPSGSASPKHERKKRKKQKR